ncbi:MAG: hypothetical protein ACK4S4_03085 [Pyrinomonadaceae bacterium]
MAKGDEFFLANTRASVHFVCFDCRVSFRQPGSSHWDPTVPTRAFPCPECRSPMQPMGRHFKAPPRRDKRQWLKVELLYQHGERFESGTSGLNEKCRTLADTVEYLATQGRSADSVLDVLHRIQRQRRGGSK